MKTVALLLLLFCTSALATGRTPTGHPANATADANSTSSAVANVYPTASNYGGSAWAVGLPGHGSPSYAGNYSICVRGSGIGWNFFWSWAFDPECVRLIAELDRLKTPPPAAMAPAPVPAAALVPVSAPAPAAAAPAACTPPAKAKTVAAAKKAGACK